jgi:hypothetical protein
MARALTGIEDLPHTARALWGPWVLANAIGELIGLGGTAVLAFVLVGSFESSESPAALAIAACMVAAGAFEGTVVGTAQWIVLRRPLPEMRAGVWVAATVTGALVAWAAGMLPSTAAEMSGAEAGPPPVTSDALVYSLAAVMGLVLGAVLALPQWLALRRHVRRAALWIPANSVAWLVGMPIVFYGVSLVANGPADANAVFSGALTLLCAGAAAGAVHGAVLIRLISGATHPCESLEPASQDFRPAR